MNPEQSIQNGNPENEKHVKIEHLEDALDNGMIEEENGTTQMMVQVKVEENNVNKEEIDQEIRVGNKDDEIVEEEDKIKKFSMNDLKDMKKCMYGNQKNQKKIINRL